MRDREVREIWEGGLNELYHRSESMERIGKITTLCIREENIAI